MRRSVTILMKPLRPGIAQQIGLIVTVFLGMAASMPVMMSYSLGALMTSLQASFGWSRADISLAYSALTLCIFVGGPFIGRLADRFAVWRVWTASMTGFGLTLILLPLVLDRPATLYLGYALASILGLGTSALVLLGPVSRSFGARTGLAMGLSLSGTGAGALVAPVVTSHLAAAGGWFAAFQGLGILALVIMPIVAFGLWTCAPADAGSDGGAVAVRDGMAFGQAARTWAFTALCLIAFGASFAVAGLMVHLLPWLRDSGMDGETAAWLAGTMGVATIAGRIVAGLLMDHVQRSSVGLFLFGIGAVGIGLVVLLGPKGAVIGVPLAGFAIGSEIDLIGYLTARYFGQRAFSSIFGWFYGLTAVGAASGPYVYGRLRDAQGDYQAAFLTGAAVLAMAALLTLTTGHYRYRPASD